MSAPAIEAVDLVKKFDDFTAVDGVSFSVPAGTVFSMLGPNGAGKTTTVRMMTTLSRPTSGTARVAGFDVVAEPDAVRHRMGLTAPVRDRRRAAHRPREHPADRRPLRPRPGPRATVERRAARAVLAHRGGRARSSRTTPAACGAGSTSRSASSRRRRCSSSTSRRPGSTRAAASSCGGCCATSSRDGTTLFLTTQYLDEADQLADRIVVVDHGRIIAAGHPARAQGPVRAGQPRRHGQPAGRGRRPPPTSCVPRSATSTSTTTRGTSPRRPRASPR